jgi:hypothetical protein
MSMQIHDLEHLERLDSLSNPTGGLSSITQSSLTLSDGLLSLQVNGNEVYRTAIPEIPDSRIRTSPPRLTKENLRDLDRWFRAFPLRSLLDSGT